MRMCLLLMLLVAKPLAAQQIVTGSAAARQFLYKGKAVHPFCVDFPQEGSSRPTPVSLDKCSDTRVVPKSHPDGFEAEYPREEGDFSVSFPAYNSYTVLGKKGDRFLIVSDSSGGGSGQFSNLFWVRLTDNEIAVVKDETGGDRCAGRISGYATERRAVRFDVDTPAAEIIRLTEAKIDSSVTDRLQSGYADCNGAAHYRYDLATEKIELVSVEPNVPDAPDAAANDPQACYDRFVRQYNKNKQKALKPAELKEFGRAFVTMCGAGQSR